MILDDIWNYAAAPLKKQDNTPLLSKYVDLGTQKYAAPPYQLLQTILLVDDAQSSRQIISAGVRLFLPSHDLVTARSMQEALAIVASEKNIGCAVIDDQFPRKENGLVGAHGEELFDHVKARWPSAKVVAHASSKFNIHRPYDAYVQRAPGSEIEVLKRLDELL